ncbi:porin [Aquincola sp. S2]|uniref:Porin n=1 Tax=Pseudaquabacterium terrae TaxID=2732868 RepID=A0ABX2ETQ5_9BURK|nr:porin [Aquabacterium terrae]NRF72095.1 porin [Aquabacterium terrae]
MRNTPSRYAAPLLATLALAAGPAAAQSVTIWGIVDQGLVKMNDGASIAANSGAGLRNETVVKPAWQNRLGFRRSEDLGDGLAAFFDIEHRFSADDGVAATPFWTGRSVVGLRSPKWGTLTLGRDYNPAFYPSVALDPWAWNTVGQMGLATTWARYAGNDGGPRNNNMIQWRTPDFSGLTVLTMVALGENATNRGNAVGANVVYSKGPIYAAAAVDRAKNVAAGKPEAKMWLLGGAYDFGVVRPRVLIAQSTSFAGVDTKSAMVGASVPIGLGRVLLGWSKINPDGANNDSTKWGLGFHYDMSKRTMLYADVGSAKTDRQSRSNGYDVGIKHSF